jgi:hypothetical protein
LPDCVGLSIPPRMILPPSTLPNFAIILFLRYKLSNRKTPTIAAIEIGNDISTEIAILIAKDIPIQIV